MWRGVGLRLGSASLAGSDCSFSLRSFFLLFFSTLSLFFTSLGLNSDPEKFGRASCGERRETGS